MLTAMISKPVLTDFLLETLHGGHFNPAGEAPRRPDVDQHDLTVVVAEASETSIEIIDLEFRSDGSDGDRLNAIWVHPGEDGSAQRPLLTRTRRVGSNIGCSVSVQPSCVKEPVWNSRVDP